MTDHTAVPELKSQDLEQFNTDQIDLPKTFTGLTLRQKAKLSASIGSYDKVYTNKNASAPTTSTSSRPDLISYIKRPITEKYLEGVQDVLFRLGLDEIDDQYFNGNFNGGNSDSLFVNLNLNRINAKGKRIAIGVTYYAAKSHDLPEFMRLDEYLHLNGYDVDHTTGEVIELATSGEFISAGQNFRSPDGTYGNVEGYTGLHHYNEQDTPADDVLFKIPRVYGDYISLWPNQDVHPYKEVDRQVLDYNLLAIGMKYESEFEYEIYDNITPNVKDNWKILDVIVTRYDGHLFDEDGNWVPDKQIRQGTKTRKYQNHIKGLLIDQSEIMPLYSKQVVDIIDEGGEVNGILYLNGEKAAMIANYILNDINDTGWYATCTIGGEGRPVSDKQAELFYRMTKNGTIPVVTNLDNDPTGNNMGKVNQTKAAFVAAGIDEDNILFTKYDAKPKDDLGDYFEDGGCPYDLIELIEGALESQKYQRQEQLRLEEEERQRLAAELEEKKVKLSINSFFQIQIDATIKLRNNYKIYKLKSRQQKVNDILESDFFADEYKRISELYKDTPDLIQEKINTFKNAIRGVIDCQRTFNNPKAPGKSCKSKRQCKCNNCPNCVEYLASTRLRYIDNVIRVHQTTLDEARELTDEIKTLLKDFDIDYLTVVCSPSHTGLGLIRVSCLLPEVTNMLVTDDPLVNEARDFIDDIDNYFKFLRKVEKQPTTKSHEHIYLINDTGQTITAVDIYLSRYEGRSAPQETGTKRGFEFDEISGQVVYKTKDQKKEERKEQKRVEQGIKLSFASPSIDLDNVPKQYLEAALTKTVDELSEHDEKAVFNCNGSENSIKHVSILFGETFRNNIEIEGYSQPRHYKEVDLTQDEIDDFISTLAVDTVIPSDILTATYELIDKPKSLSERMDWVRTSEFIRNQQKVVNAPTKAEFIAMAMESYLGKDKIENPNPDEPDPAVPF